MKDFPRKSKQSDTNMEVQPKSFAVVLILERPAGTDAEQMGLLCMQQLSVGLGMAPQMRAHIMAPSELDPSALHFDLTAALTRGGSRILT